MTQQPEQTPNQMREEARKLYGFARQPVRWSQASAFEARARMKHRADDLMRQATEREHRSQ